MLANVTDEEIAECKRKELLDNSPAKRVLSRLWAMNWFAAGKYLCKEDAIVRVMMELTTGKGRDAKHAKKTLELALPILQM